MGYGGGDEVVLAKDLGVSKWLKLKPAYRVDVVIVVGVADVLSSHRMRLLPLGFFTQCFHMQEFSRRIAVVLKREPPKPADPRSSGGRFVVKLESKVLYELLKKPLRLEKIKKF
ncbi:MAG: hypothetical protein QXM16_05070 [Nitrososphaerota archaeon]